MAFTGVAALMAAEAGTVTVAMVAAAAVEVGTAMVVVGAVTGNRDLVKVGGYMSLAGGIGGLASSAMSGGAAASSAASGAEGTVGAAPDMLPDAIDVGGGFNPATGAGDAVTANAAAAGSQGIISDAAYAANPTDMRLADGTQASPLSDSGTAAATDGTATATPAGATGDAAVVSGDSQSALDAKFGNTPAGGGAVNTPATDITSPTAVQTPMGSTQPTTGAPTTGGGSGGSLDPNVNPTDIRLANGTQAAPISTPNYFGKMMSVLQDPKNKLMVEMGSKLVGGALQGAQQQSQFNDKLALEKARIAQTSYGSQVAQNKPRRGIIQGAKA